MKRSPFHTNNFTILPAIRQNNYDHWERFVYKGILAEGVRDLVKESWKRCARLNVEPFTHALAKILLPKELAVRKNRRKHLLQIAKPYIKTLYNLVAGDGFTIVITDEEGVVLLIDGDEEEIAKHRQTNLVEGAIWTEKEAGTNAVGVAIILHEPVQIVGCEHYCVTRHNFTCSVAPILDSDGKMLGVLNMSAASEKVYLHTLGMVVATAKAIENQLRIEKALNEVIKANNTMKTTLMSVQCGILTLDELGVVNQINLPAANMLQFDLEEAIGKHIDVVFAATPHLSQVVTKGVVMDNVEVSVTNDKGTNHYTVNARPIITSGRKVEGAVAVIQNKEAVTRLVNEQTGAQAQFNFNSILGKSKKLEQAKEIARKIGLTNSSVLLLGESGTGKELFAQSIHNASRRKGPFIAVNCSAMPRSLIESELFGYESGSFTGANRNGRPGKFERANGGSFFLDEIGDMPLDLQAVLLRVLQERQVVRVGGFKPIPIDVRVIAATNKDLRTKVAEGTFREDLYFRLNVVTVNIPPLRERKEDIPVLLEYFLARLSQRLGKKVTGVNSRTLKTLMGYDWPGNVRELENAIERGIIVASEETIRVEDLPELLSRGFTPAKGKELLSMVEMEKRTIITTLSQIHGIAESAKILGISRSTLYRKMNEYNLTENEFHN